ncbi:MAG: 23S rRNA (guanosine(2251)-2'-O)-methyltransferase RlmB [Aristaeellaceae bacterium]
MKNDDRRAGAYRGNRNMQGASRRTYPLREDGEAAANRGGYAGNRGGKPDRDGGYAANRSGKSEHDGGYAVNRGGKPERDGGYAVNRGGKTERSGGYTANRGGKPRGAGPRVGAIYDNVPRAQRVDAEDVRENPSAAPRRQQINPVIDAEMHANPAMNPEENENLLVGRNPIREALKSGRTVEKLLVAQGDLSGAAKDIIRMARDAGAVVQTVDRSRLDQIYPAHQGMLAYVAAVDYKSLDDILALAQERGEDPFIVILDGVTDPHNLGAIIRSAECAGAHGVILPERRAAGLGPAAAKAAAGALNYLPIARVKNLNRTIDELKQRGVWVIGTAMDGEDALTADLTGPVALVIGSEGEGISHLTLQKCDRTVTLPMKGQIVSLNASVAAGILMYEIVRARAK